MPAITRDVGDFSVADIGHLRCGDTGACYLFLKFVHREPNLLLGGLDSFQEIIVGNMVELEGGEFALLLVTSQHPCQVNLLVGFGVGEVEPLCVRVQAQKVCSGRHSVIPYIKVKRDIYPDHIPGHVSGLGVGEGQGSAAENKHKDKDEMNCAS